MTSQLDTSTPAAAAPKSRKRIAPFIRVALEYADGRWEFYESLRSMRGRVPKAGLILSGAGREDVLAAITKMVPRVVFVYPAPDDVFTGVHFYSAPEVPAVDPAIPTV